MNYNPLRNEDDPDNQKKKEIYRIKFIFHIFTILNFFKGDLLQGICFYFIFACSFGANTSSPQNYGGKQCVVLLGWGRAASFYLTMGCIVFCIVNPILTCTMPNIRNCFASAPEWIFQKLLYYIRCFIYAWGAIIFVGLMIALGYNENCRDLTSATGFFIFVVIVTLIIIGLCYYYVLKDDDTTTYQNVNNEQNPQQAQNYGTLENQEQNEEKQKQDVQVVVDENQQQQQKQQIDNDDPDKRLEKPKEEMNVLN